MRRAISHSALSVASVPVLILVLIVLAVLQYNWSGQVSDADRRRMQNGLREAVTGFREEYYRELLRLCTAFQLETPPKSSREWPRYVERYGLWAETSLNPDLVASVYIWEVPGATPARLLRVNRKSGTVEAVPMQRQIGRLIERLALEVEDFRHASGRDVRLFGWTLDDQVPALISPVLFPAAAAGKGPQMPQLGGYLIICLSQNNFANVIFPELAARHFRANADFTFRVAVVAREDPDEVLFQSDPSVARDARTSSDMRISLLGPPPDGLLRQPPPGNREGQPARIVPLIQPLNEGRWLLVVKHKEGSVDAVVNRIRRRHLALSFGVLLVLALGMATMIVSTQRARRLAQLQVDFVAGVSHELRTPVAVICSAGENLADGIVHSGPQVVRYGEVVRNEGRRLAGMIEQILVFAARRTGRRYQLCEVDISEVIREVLADADSLIQQSRISAEIEIEPRLPAAMADPLALKQCIQNLVANAIKYGGSSRWMAVRARTAGGSGRPEIEIRVEDKGIGIDQSDLPYIFEPFYRSRAVRDRQIRGFGLGLALAKETAEALGGSISVTSKPGEGSCFTLRLPSSLSESRTIA